MISILVPIIISIIFFIVVWVLLIRLNSAKQIKPEFRIIKMNANKSDIIFTTNLRSYLIFKSVLALYKKEDDFERFYGIVIVKNIQENYVQGSIKYNSDIIEDIKKENLIIKAGVGIEDLKRFI